MIVGSSSPTDRPALPRAPGSDPGRADRPTRVGGGWGLVGDVGPRRPTDPARRRRDLVGELGSGHACDGAEGALLSRHAVGGRSGNLCVERQMSGVCACGVPLQFVSWVFVYQRTRSLAIETDRPTDPIEA